MTLKDNKSIKKAVVLVAVVVITGAIGVVLSAQMGPRRGPDGQGARGPGMAQGPGMMGGPMMGGPGMMRGHRGGGFGGPMGLAGFGARELGVTDEQRKQMQGIFEAHKDELKTVGDKVMEARKALREAMASEAADEATIRDVANAVGAAESEAIVAQFRVRKEAFQVLTPEQQQKAKELRGRMNERMNERMKNGRERMQPRQNQRLDQKGGGPQAV
jgi:Spy/CpxP family protein refolding chaperone